MKSMIPGVLAAFALSVGAPALAQAACAARFCVDSTPIGVIWADPEGKKILLKELPPIEQYMDQIKDETLAQVAPESDGRIDDAKLKALQDDFNTLGPATKSR
jgi:hypothetical protein